MALVACGDDDDAADTDSGGSGDGGTVGIVNPSTNDDGAAGQDVFKGASAAAKKAGYEVISEESVATADAPQVLRQMAQQGADPVVILGEEFLTPTEQVAPEFPDTSFVIAYDATKPSASNVTGVNPDPGSVSYVIGVAAGLMTKTNKLGFVTGDRAAINEGAITGWTAGAQSVNPDAKVKVVVTGDFSDVQKNVEGAQALIDDGADVLLGNLDAANAPVMRAAQNGGVMATAYLADFHDVAPKAVITSGLTQTDKIVEKSTTQAIDGTLKGGQLYFYGLTEGIGALGPFGSFVPANVKSQVEETKDKVASGEIKTPPPPQ